MIGLDADTVRAIRAHFNMIVRVAVVVLAIVVRATVIALAWSCLLIINFLFSWLINTALGWIGANQAVTEFLSQMMLVIVGVIGILATWTSLKDAWRLTKIGVANPNVHSDDGEKRGFTDDY